MKNYLSKETLIIGFAMFSMFFGAGNIIFPLAVGQYAADKNVFAILGLIATAAFVPIMGVIGMIVYNGSYREFFGRLGKIPGFLLAFATIALLGPLGSTPRCIALSYTTLHTAFLDISPTLFCAISCVLIYLFALKKESMYNLLGIVLTPMLLLSLFFLIIAGFIAPHETPIREHSSLQMFFHGLMEGYNTMDLLASFFFSATIVGILRARGNEGKPLTTLAIRASIIGALLLGVVYIGFSYLAAFHAASAVGGKDELLSQIALKVAGPYGGILVCSIISLACLTTAIALISAFTDFVQKEIFQQKISYELTLFGSLLITFFVSTFEFRGISAFIEPIMVVCYPGLIVLTFLNILHRLTGMRMLKLPVFLTFAASAVQYCL